MSKIDLDPITSGYNLSKINSNFQRVEDELNNKVLYRDSPAGEPNSMSSNLDMNGRAILNANKISSNVLELGGVQVVPTNLAVDPYNGTREALRRSYAEAGYNVVGTFRAGFTIVNTNDIGIDEVTGKGFAGPAGPVFAGTNPTFGGFVDVSNVSPTINAWDPKFAGGVASGNLDNSDAFDAVVAYAKSIGGAEIVLPRGALRHSREILIDSPSISFVGTGRRKPYPGIFVYTTNVTTTLLPLFSGSGAIRIYSASINVASTFQCRNMNLATLESGARPTAAIAFDGSGNFQRDFTFDNVGIHGFTSAFDTYNTGGDTAFGLIKIRNCAINRNGHIARNLTGQWNGFVFENNEAGQNLNGGLDIKAQAASILRNALEGQPNPVRINGNYRAPHIAGNYFELNSGDYVIELSETLGAVVGPNFWQNITATEKLKLVYDVGTTVLDRVIPSCLGSFDLRSSERAIDPVPLGSASAAFFCDQSFIKSGLPGFLEVGGNQVAAPAGPHYAIPESAGSLYVSTGSGLTAVTESGLSIPSGNYIGVCFCVSYQDIPTLPPRFELRVNSTNTQGYTNPIFYSFNKASVDVKNKTVLYFGAVKALAACSSFQTFMYPFGLNPPAGSTCFVSPVAVYDLGSSIPSVVNVGAGVQAFIPDTHVQRVQAAPASGTWPIGYKLHARAPVAGGFEGWICTAGGTPGTWKTFGPITA